MTYLERIFKLLENYDGLAEAGIKCHPSSSFATLLLKELREEKKSLSKHLLNMAIRGHEDKNEGVY